MMKRTRIISPGPPPPPPARPGAAGAPTAASSISSRRSDWPSRSCSIASRASHTQPGRPWLPTTDVGSIGNAVVMVASPDMPRPVCDARARRAGRAETDEPALCSRSRPVMLAAKPGHRRAILVGGQARRELLLHTPSEFVEADVEGLAGEALARRHGRLRQGEKTLGRSGHLGLEVIRGHD